MADMINSKCKTRKKDTYMKKTNKLFNIFLIISLALTILGALFATLSLFSTYTEAVANVRILALPTVLFIVFASFSFILPIVQAILIKNYKITRAKDDMFLVKISSILAALAIFFLVIHDCVMLASKFETWKLFRIIIGIPFIFNLIFNIFPNKVPSFVRYACALSPIAFCLFSNLAIYFHPGPGPVPEFFRITFSVVYIFGALFFLYDFKWNSYESSTRIYVALTTIFTSLGFIVSISSLLYIAFGDMAFGHSVVTFFEAFVLILFATYALSKVFALKRAVGITTSLENKKTDTPPTENN